MRSRSSTECNAAGVDASALEYHRIYGFGYLALCILFAVGAGCDHTSPQSRQVAPQGKTSDAPTDEFAGKREAMVRLLEHVVKDRRVLDAMRRIPRHEFVPSRYRSFSYDPDDPLPIPKDQTISAPNIVAIMSEALALNGSERVLEIGTGSGYQAAVLGELAREVYSVEIISSLAESARNRLKDLRQRGILSYKKLEVITGDGYRGYPPAAPFDRIIVTAAPREVPTELINQLKPGGKMVIPVGEFRQELQLITKNEDGTLSTENLLPVLFVPMVPGRNE